MTVTVTVTVTVTLTFFTEWWWVAHIFFGPGPPQNMWNGLMRLVCQLDLSGYVEEEGHTHIHTLTPYMCTRLQPCKCTPTPAYRHTRTHARTHVLTHTHTHTRTHIHTHTHTHTHTHMHTNAAFRRTNASYVPYVPHMTCIYVHIHKHGISVHQRLISCLCRAHTHQHTPTHTPTL